MSKLLVSGDSWTSCWPLEELVGHRNFGWPTIVAQKLNFDLVDKSRSGDSNYRIYRKAFDGLLSEKIDLALIFLTSWTRFETGATYGTNPGGIYQHRLSENHLNTKYAFENFFNGYKQYTDMLRMVISLQSLASVTNCPCYFLDTFDNNLLFDISEDDFKNILSYNIKIFDNMDDNRIADKFQKVKMLTSKIDTSKFVSLSSYQTIIKGCKLEKGHPIEDGHAMIADKVLNFLKEKQHGKTI